MEDYAPDGPGSALADEEAIETLRVVVRAPDTHQTGSALADEEAIETHVLRHEPSLYSRRQCLGR